MDEQERYEAGLEIRRAVLGDAYVEQSLANLTPFNTPFQNLINRYAWSEIRKPSTSFLPQRISRLCPRRVLDPRCRARMCTVILQCDV
ncbi:MAG TPA: hypothetical protein VJR48_08495 [Ktedonobacterales bacterium]|nr:hypothetical protein [Ktedonobacterales bacterium]